ncbi:unnamed protein product, partial [Porites evermanni]
MSWRSQWKCMVVVPQLIGSARSVATKQRWLRLVFTNQKMDSDDEEYVCPNCGPESPLEGVELTTSLAAASEQPDQTKDKRKISSNEKRKSPSGELKDDQGTPRKFSKT